MIFSDLQLPTALSLRTSFGSSRFTTPSARLIMNPAIAYISAGSNIGDKEKNLHYGLEALEQAGTLLQISPFFETEPVGHADQPWFLNIAIGLETLLTPSELLQQCLKIEESCGRRRTIPDAPRTLDLDLLFYGDTIIQEADLVLPHPRLAERRFVLEPMARIAPDFVHPLLHKSMRTLLKECTDRSCIRLAQIK